MTTSVETRRHDYSGHKKRLSFIPVIQKKMQFRMLQAMREIIVHMEIAAPASETSALCRPHTHPRAAAGLNRIRRPDTFPTLSLVIRSCPA